MVREIGAPRGREVSGSEAFDAAPNRQRLHRPEALDWTKRHTTNFEPTAGRETTEVQDGAVDVAVALRTSATLVAATGSRRNAGESVVPTGRRPHSTYGDPSG